MTTTVPRTSLWPALVGAVRGTVLELGPGDGATLRYYHPDVRLVAVEPDATARARVRAAADRLGLRARVVDGRAEELALPDGSVDAVVCSFVLCSVADQAAVLAEVHRVLRPGGRFLFAEHVAAPAGTWVRRGQNLVAALTAPFGARCRPNRETGLAIGRAGFDVVDLHRFDLPGPLGAGIPHLAGAGQRRCDLEGHLP
ncbi:class I SAM-dependent methyltransferase [Actinophytocola sp. NPDC049390]|uniref:class I SAM-dependent methyltransferase n=1 Tax=Actinophytocola sp. NPDC049390 TaxID=3363894 RepID=UPI00378DD262